MSEAEVPEELPTSAFYTADHVAEDPSACPETAKKVKLDPESPEFEDFFEVERVVDWIKSNGYSRTAMQLPDSLLHYAVPLAIKVEKLSKSMIFVLADTSYRSCCVDAVAAEHSNCDSLVHFGEACLSSPTEDIPVLYVYGKYTLDWDDFESQLKEHATEEHGRILIVLYEPGYDNVADKLDDMTNKAFPHATAVQTLRLAAPGCKNSLGREIPKDFPNSLVFIGSPDSALLPIWLMTHTTIDRVYSYSPDGKTLSVDTPTTNRQLRKRLYCIEKLKDANVIGLVVGTLGVEGVKEAITRIRTLCKEAQKKVYVLSIGKVNEPKLSNFANDIDCFILLSCPFGIILEANDFFKPIVSLFEAEIALNPAKEWYAAGGWTAQFTDFVQDDIGKHDVDAVDVSLISGKIRATQVEEDGQGDNADKQLLQYSAGDYFANRTWKGLDNSYVEEDLSLNEGLKGVAMEYNSEPPKQ